MRRWAIAAVLLTGCIRTSVNLDGRPCPCVAGWVCCEATNVCLRPTDVCSSAGAELPDADARPDAGRDASLDAAPDAALDGALDATVGCNPTYPCGQDQLCFYDQGGCVPGVCRSVSWCSGDAAVADASSASDSGVTTTGDSSVGDASASSDSGVNMPSDGGPLDAYPSDTGPELPVYCGCDGRDFIPSGCLVQKPWAHFGSCSH